MKRVIVSLTLVAALMLVPFTAYAKGSPTPGSGRSGGGGGGSVTTTTKSTTTTTAASTPGAINKRADGAVVFIKPDGSTLKSDWAVVTVNGVNSWRYFDAEGKMMTGWVWIKGADGKTKCYYLGKDGACVLNGTTEDGYTVNANGEWVKDGVVQTK